MRAKPAVEPPFPGDPNTPPAGPPSRPSAADLAVQAKVQRTDLSRMVDPVWRAGLHDIVPSNHITHGRHRPELLDVSQVATPDGRCICVEFGGRCVHWADAEDLLCTACRIACVGAA